MLRNSKKIKLGWREWVSLPELGISWIKTKVDTGARTSAIHAFKMEPYTIRGVKKIRFSVHPLQREKKQKIICTANIADFRWVTDSGGHREKRYVIKTLLSIGDFNKEIEITLTNRDTMIFRMLLGRSALKKDFMVDPAVSYTQGKL